MSLPKLHRFRSRNKTPGVGDRDYFVAYYMRAAREFHNGFFDCRFPKYTPQFYQALSETIRRYESTDFDIAHDEIIIVNVLPLYR